MELQYFFSVCTEITQYIQCVANFEEPYAQLGGLLTGEFHFPSHARLFLKRLEEAEKAGYVDISSNTFLVRGPLDAVQVGEDPELVDHGFCVLPYADLLRIAREWLAYVEEKVGT